MTCRACVIVLAASLLIGCDRSTPTPDAQPIAVSVAEFQNLRWLEGTWRGTGGGIPAFYEGYRWLDDSTIRKYDFADSTITAPSDSGVITLRSGAVRTGTAPYSWVVVALDSSSVRFAPEGSAANGFEWKLTAPGAWSARLTWDSAGVPRERLYEMRTHAAGARAP